MKIIGICYDVWISSACIVENGKILAAAPEERFTRIKREREFPKNSISYCLKIAGCSLKDIDYIAIGWNPAHHLKSYNPRYSKTLRWRAEYLTAVPNSLLQFSEDKQIYLIEENLKGVDCEHKIIYIDHHMAHAANAFFLSSFDEAAIFTADGRGEDEVAIYARGKSNKIQKMDSMVWPHSIGVFYQVFTQFLGFVPHSDEWKVMALGAYTDSTENPYYEKIKKLVQVDEEGQIELNLSYFDYYLHDQLYFYSKRFVKDFGLPRKKDNPLEEKHYQIAEALQRVTEETLINCLNYLHEKTKLSKLVLNGGVFMNSVFNGKILSKTKFKEVFISSCPDDSGTCIGAALYVYNQKAGENALRVPQTHNYYGPEFKDDEIKETLDKYKVVYKYIQNIEKFAAEKIASGKLIGWFQGKMEFGQRALGNRSILCDARDPNMKNKVNLAVKYRESFRPFAPSILQEHKQDFFEIEENSSVDFMEKVYMIKKEKQKIIPAVTHADGSGRLHTVNKETNPKYYQLIFEFKNITGVPIVLNTSFNLNGEPIVCSPTDAIRTFYSCGLDLLILGNYVIEK